MIDSIAIRIKYQGIDLFKQIYNISYDENADIQILEWPATYESYDPEKFKILYLTKVSSEMAKPANYIAEIWVNTLEDKTALKKSGLIAPVIILTTDKELLPYCMKDRLAYLQDRINKEKKTNEYN